MQKPPSPPDRMQVPTSHYYPSTPTASPPRNSQSFVSGTRGSPHSRILAAYTPDSGSITPTRGARRVSQQSEGGGSEQYLGNLPSTGLVRRSAERRRPSGTLPHEMVRDSDGFPVSIQPVGPRRVSESTIMGSPRTKRPEIDTSRLEPSHQKDRSTLSAHSEQSHGGSSIPSGHPSATSSKAGTPVAERDNYVNGGPEANHLTIPSETRPRTIRSVSGPSFHSEEPAFSRNAEPFPEAFMRRSSSTTTPGYDSRPSSRASPSASSSPLRHKKSDSAIKSSTGRSSIPSEDWAKHHRGPTMSDNKGEHLRHTNFSQDHSRPLLGPALSTLTAGAPVSRRASEQRVRLHGRAKDATSSRFSSSMSNSRSTSPASHHLSPKRASTISGHHLTSSLSMPDLASPTLDSHQFSDFPSDHHPHSDHTSSASSRADQRADSCASDRSFVPRPTLPGPLPRKSSARPKHPSLYLQDSASSSLVGIRDRDGYIVPCPPGTYRPPESRKGGLDVMETPNGRRFAATEIETVGQRRHQPELRIQPSPPRLSRLSYTRDQQRIVSQGTIIQRPSAPARSTSDASTVTQYMTPPLTASEINSGPPTATPNTRQNLEPIETDDSKLNAGSMYTKVEKSPITPPIPARSPLRPRADSKGDVGRATTPGPPVSTESLAMAAAGTWVPSGPQASQAASHHDVGSSTSIAQPIPTSSRSGSSSTSKSMKQNDIYTVEQVDLGSYEEEPTVNFASMKQGLGISSAKALESAATEDPTSTTPNTAEMVRVMGYAAELEAKSFEHNKNLPPTPEEGSPPSGVSEQFNRLQDERFRYPHRADSIEHLTRLQSAAKSPSMPNFALAIGPATPESVVSPTTSDQRRPRHPSGEGPREPRPISAHIRSQSHPINSPAIPSPGLSNLSMSSSVRMSKRAHLIAEIWSTERSYANDLALIRDVYLLKLQPSGPRHVMSPSFTSTTEVTSPGGFSTHSRNSTYFDSPGNRLPDALKTDGGALHSGDLVQSPFDQAPRPGLPRSPSSMVSTGFANGLSRPSSGVFSMSQSGEFQYTSPTVPDSQSKRRQHLLSDALSSSDIKTVFINLDQLVQFADELAASFEKAMGDASGMEHVMTGKETNDTSDRLGKTFLAVSSQLTSLYTTYCAKQAQANGRLLELMQDRKTAAHLKSLWTLVQPFTNAWDLGSMLIKPVQRVMKYPLLFGDLLQCTSPVHPDYFNLRKAFDQATSIAAEINEVKRRKDVIERFNSRVGKKRPSIPGSSSSLSKETTKVFGMSAKLRERFGKSKDKSVPTVGSGPNAAGPSAIVPGSERHLYELAARLDAADQVVRKVGKEVNHWPDKMRETWRSQRDMMITWSALVSLDGSAVADERMEMYIQVVDDILDEPMAVLEEGIRTTVMPTFTTLLKLGVNPKALIQKRESRLSDYVKVQRCRNNDLKSVDKPVLQGAEDFVALHTQLLEELPSYIANHGKILELALAKFAAVQAKFFDAVRTRMRDYLLLYTPSGTEGDYVKVGMEIEVVNGQKIVEEWIERCRPTVERLEGLRTTNFSAHGFKSSRVSSSSSFNPNRPSDDMTTTINQTNPSRTLTYTSSPSRPGSTVSETGTHYLSDFTVQPSSAGATATIVPDGHRPRSFLPPLNTSGTLHLPQVKAGAATPASAATKFLESSPVLDHDGNALEWKDQEILYQCACVAPFALDVDVWYAGLPFLNMEEGTVIDILNEVGRIDQLDDLPIDVGVPDDGLLVGKNRQGMIGLMLCSFLEPIQDGI